MKRLITICCTVLLAGIMTAALVACSEPAEEHKHTMNYVEAVEATCTEDGHIAYYVCSGCGKTFSDEEGNHEITYESAVTDAVGHTLTKTEGKAATCTEAGNIEYYTCSACGKTFSDAEGKAEVANVSVSAAGHKMTRTAAKAATCTEAGNIEYYTCSVCDKMFSDAEGKTEVTEVGIPAAGHKMTKTEAVDATCTESGNIEYYTCSACGKMFSDAEGKTEVTEVGIPAAGHKLTKTEAVDATCTEAGNIEYYTCSACGKTFSDAEGKTEVTEVGIPAAGHKLTKTEAKEATCAEAGNIEYYTCSACGKTFSDAEGKTEVTEVTIPVKAHTEPYTAEVTQAPTASAAGSAELKCPVCEKTMQTITLPALTEANVENGTYDYTVSYRFSSRGYYRDGLYTYADSDVELEGFRVQGTGQTMIQGRSNFQFRNASSATLSISVPTTSIDELDEETNRPKITTGSMIMGAAGWYKLTVGSSTDVAFTVTLISPDGSAKDFLITSDQLSATFETVTASNEYCMLVFHSASEQVQLEITVEETTVPTVTVSEELSITLPGGNRGLGEAVTMMVGNDIEAGTYRLVFSGTVLLWRCNVSVVVNGVTYNLSAKPAEDYNGYYVETEFKPGDTITVACDAVNDLTVTAILEPVSE